MSKSFQDVPLHSAMNHRLTNNIKVENIMTNYVIESIPSVSTSEEQLRDLHAEGEHYNWENAQP